MMSPRSIARSMPARARDRNIGPQHFDDLGDDSYKSIQGDRGERIDHASTASKASRSAIASSRARKIRDRSCPMRARPSGAVATMIGRPRPVSMKCCGVQEFMKVLDSTKVLGVDHRGWTIGGWTGGRTPHEKFSQSKRPGK